MDIFKEFINEYATTILSTVITAVVSFIGVSIKKLYTKYINDKTKQSIVATCVAAIEQMYKHLNGAEKLDKCIKSASEMLNEKGITISDIEIRMLIESSVSSMNKQISDIFDGLNTAGDIGTEYCECAPDPIEDEPDALSVD